MPNILAFCCSTHNCSVALLTGELRQGQESLADLEANCTELSLCRKRSHHRLIMPMIDRLLTEANISPTELDSIVCDLGPGSFVGVRIAIGVAQGIGYANSLKVIGITSLEILAVKMLTNWRAANEQITSDKEYRNGEVGVISMLDSKPGEVYWAYYRTSKNTSKNTSKHTPKNLSNTNDAGFLKEVVPPTVGSIQNINISSELPVAIPILVCGGKRENVDAVANKLHHNSEIMSCQYETMPSAKYLLQAAMPRWAGVVDNAADVSQLLPVYLSAGVQSRVQ